MPSSPKHISKRISGMLKNVTVIYLKKKKNNKNIFMLPLTQMFSLKFSCDFSDPWSFIISDHKRAMISMMKSISWARLYFQ